jgi:hypothetical protein
MPAVGQMELEQARAECARFPTAVGSSMLAVRVGTAIAPTLAGSDHTIGVPDEGMRHWIFAPPVGMPLILALPGARKEVPNPRSGIEAREVLTGGLLTAYLTCWALWSRTSSQDGSFQMDLNWVAESRGFRMYNGAHGSGGYGSPMADFKMAVANLECVGLRGAGRWRASTPEPLINRHTRDDGLVWLQHAPLALRAMRDRGSGGHAQFPLAALRLDAQDAPIALGLAALWRKEIVVSALAPGAPGYWRGPLRTVLERCGDYNAARVAKMGGPWWAMKATELKRIALAGEFAEEADVDGAGPHAVVTLTPSPLLAAVYAPLLERRREAAQQELAAKELAPVVERIVEKVGRTRRRRRSSKP